tara:strand:- start:56 stop:1702 length:1647 start_codon:yes stop_codon:yes gene_type:complete
MSQIELYIKNIIKIKLSLVLISAISIMYSQDYTNDRIDTKQKKLDNIDSEINSLEKKLNLEIQSVERSEEKIIEIEKKLNEERIKISNNRYGKEKQKIIIDEANIILDSLNTDLSIIEDNQQSVSKILDDINQNKKVINYKIVVLDDSINVINKAIDNKLGQLKEVKQKTKKLVKETIFQNSPTDIEFMLESNTWDVFVVNSTLYKLLIDTQAQKFQTLITEYEKINLDYKEDSIKKVNLQLEQDAWNKKQADYKQQLNNFTGYKNKLDKMMNDKKKMIETLVLEYEKLGAKLNQAKSKVIALELELNTINQKNETALKEQEKIKSQLIIKKESRKLIRNEILKLIENTKKFKGVNIKKLKGKLPWPINGKIITKFGKRTNPDSKVTINYDLIEIQPTMTDEEIIISLAKQINPNNPNKSIVKKFQSKTMNLKNGDRGFGVFGPQTTKMWKKYNKMIITSEFESIYAIHDGIIENINFINPIVGVVIIIRHDDDYFSVYNGNIEVSVMKGSVVKPGQKIGSINKQNILSFQLWNNNTPINPEKWLIKK